MFKFTFSSWYFCLITDFNEAESVLVNPTFLKVSHHIMLFVRAFFSFYSVSLFLSPVNFVTPVVTTKSLPAF